MAVARERILPEHRNLTVPSPELPGADPKIFADSLVGHRAASSAFFQFIEGTANARTEYWAIAWSGMTAPAKFSATPNNEGLSSPLRICNCGKDILRGQMTA